MSTHPTHWLLQRLHAGELSDKERSRADEHVATCASCQGVLDTLAAEQAGFEAAVPFERFAAGVEKAARTSSQEPSSPRVQGWLAALAVGVLLVVTVRPLLTPPEANRLKGGSATAELRIGGEGPQRSVLPGDTDTLLPGERVRLGYVAGTYRYVLALSVDEGGEVSPLYAERGRSLAVAPGEGRHWLPESTEFTGGGQERVVLVLSTEPLRMEAVAAAARRAWEQAGRSVAAMSSLGVEGQETQWLLNKP